MSIEVAPAVSRPLKYLLHLWLAFAHHRQSLQGVVPPQQFLFMYIKTFNGALQLAAA